MILLTKTSCLDLQPNFKIGRQYIFYSQQKSSFAPKSHTKDDLEALRKKVVGFILLPQIKQVNGLSSIK